MRNGVQRFVGAKLTEARQARGITSRKALADLLQRAPSTVMRWEEGDSYPEPTALAELSSVLKVPEDFFLESRTELAGPSFFRSFAGALKGERAVQLVRIAWLEDVTAVAEHYAYLPEINVPDLLGAQSFKALRDEDIEAYAMELRELWGLGHRPIPDVVELIEKHGVIVASEVMGTTKLDGLSRWGGDGRPYVLLADDKQSFARRQFDAAHELAHLVLHKSVTDDEFESQFKMIEDQAHRFASAFLLPESQYCLETEKVTMWELERLKARWRVSIKAQIVRLQKLQVIDSEAATRLFKAYSARGYQSKGEPYDNVWPLQRPSTLRDTFSAIVDAGQVSKAELRDDLPLFPHDVESLCGLPKGWLNGDTAKVIELRGVTASRRGEGRAENGTVIAFSKRRDP